MAIKLGPDVGSPLIVTAVDLVAESVWPAHSNWITYGMTAVGYVAAWAGWGGDILKNIGVSSLPLTAKRIYDSVKGAPVSRKLSYRSVAGNVRRYPAPAGEAQFGAVKLV